jgi:uncharacterized RDD family membrane protein YckC
METTSHAISSLTNVHCPTARDIDLSSSFEGAREPADLPIRIAARAVDVVVAAALNVGLGRAMGFGFDWVIVGASTILAYFALSDALFGATLGKLAFGLRVVGRNGAHPSLKQALTREAVTIVGAIPAVGPLLALASWIWIAKTIRSNPMRQGRHDVLASGTRVIRVR